MRRITIVGTGYVGLATAISLAEKGHQVTCVDRREEVLTAISEKRSLFHEPGFEDALTKIDLAVSNDLKASIESSDVSFVCVGTESVEGGNAANLTALLAATKEIGEACRDSDSKHVVIVKSTVPPGTTAGAVAGALAESSGKEIDAGELFVGMMPEFLREGCALEDSRRPGRFVVGATSSYARELITEIFAPFDQELVYTNSQSAEFAKYFSNAFFATLISFANQLETLGRKVGEVDFKEALAALLLDPRLSKFDPGSGINSGFFSYLKPGCGFGGSCFPKDLRALVDTAESLGIDLPMVKAALEINYGRANQTVQQVKELLGDDYGKSSITILGLSFKPDTDDIRESPALPIIQALIADGIQVRAHDPMAIDNFRVSLGDAEQVEYFDTVDAALESSGAALVITPWRSIVSALEEGGGASTAHTVVFDCRGALNPEVMQPQCKKYISPLYLEGDA